MVRSTVRCVVVAFVLVLPLASPACPARAQGPDVAHSPASGATAPWSRLTDWLTDLWEDLFLASDAAPTPPTSSSCTGDCDRGHGVDPNG